MGKSFVYFLTHGVELSVYQRRVGAVKECHTP